MLIIMRIRIIKRNIKKRGATHTEHNVSCSMVSSNEACHTFAQRPWWSLREVRSVFCHRADRFLNICFKHWRNPHERTGN